MIANTGLGAVVVNRKALYSSRRRDRELSALLRKTKENAANAVSSPRVSCTAILLFPVWAGPRCPDLRNLMLTVGYSPLVSGGCTFRLVRVSGSFCQSEKI